MTEYRKVIYQDYNSNHVNKDGALPRALLAEQSFYYQKELVPYLPKDRSSSIVDIGCGFGSFIQAAKNAGYSSISGVDLSPEQVALAHDLGLKEVQLKSAEQYFNESGSVDCIVGIDIIEHFTKDELIVFLQETKKHLKPGGKVIFRTPNMDATLASVYAHADFSHEIFLNKSSALQIMASCGFKQVKVHPSLIYNRSVAKEILRKCLWNIHLFKTKLILFSSGRTWDQVVFTPNLIIEATV